jgi:hypothetical protein
MSTITYFLLVAVCVSLHCACLLKCFAFSTANVKLFTKVELKQNMYERFLSRMF